jgi:hypothetical protein
MARRAAALNGLLVHGPHPAHMAAETELPEGYVGKILMVRLTGGGFEDNVSSLAFRENEVLPGGDGREQLTQFRNRRDSSSLLVARAGIEGLRTRFSCNLSGWRRHVGQYLTAKMKWGDPDCRATPSIE